MGEGSGEGQSITSEVRGHEVLPLVQVRHPGLGSLLHDHLGGETKGGNENCRIQPSMLPSTPYNCLYLKWVSLGSIQLFHLLFSLTLYKMYGETNFLNKVIILLLKQQEDKEGILWKVKRTLILITSYRVYVHAKSLQSFPTLCNPMDYSPPGSSLLRSLGKNTGVGCYALLQGIFLTQGSNPHLLHLLNCRWILYCWATRGALIARTVFP